LATDAAAPLASVDPHGLSLSVGRQHVEELVHVAIILASVGSADSTQAASSAGQDAAALKVLVRSCGVRMLADMTWCLLQPSKLGLPSLSSTTSAALAAVLDDGMMFL